MAPPSDERPIRRSLPSLKRLSLEERRSAAKALDRIEQQAGQRAAPDDRERLKAKSENKRLVEHVQKVVDALKPLEKNVFKLHRELEELPSERTEEAARVRTQIRALRQNVNRIEYEAGTSSAVLRLTLRRLRQGFEGASPEGLRRAVTYLDELEEKWARETRQSSYRTSTTPGSSPLSETPPPASGERPKTSAQPSDERPISRFLPKLKKFSVAEQLRAAKWLDEVFGKPSPGQKSEQTSPMAASRTTLTPPSVPGKGAGEESTHNDSELSDLTRPLSQSGQQPPSISLLDPDVAKYKGKAGVYGIKNIQTGKIYVGSSTDVGRRILEHLSALRGNRHHSSKLQTEWASFGAGEFAFELLESVPETDLLTEKEQHYIDQYKAAVEGYNESPYAERPRPLTEEEWPQIKDARLCFPLELVERNHSYDDRVVKQKIKLPRILEWLIGEKFRTVDQRTDFERAWDSANRVLRVVDEDGEPIVFLFGHTEDYPPWFTKFRIGTPEDGVLDGTGERWGQQPWKVSPGPMEFVDYEQVRRWLRQNTQESVRRWKGTLPGWLRGDTTKVMEGRRWAKARWKGFRT